MGHEELDIEKVEDEDSLASKIESYYQQDMHDKLFRAYEWDESIRFYDGDQHIEYNASTHRFQPVTIARTNDFIPRPTTNYILPAVRTIVSQLTKQKMQAKVRRNSTDPRDTAAAKIGDLVLDVKHEELKEEEKTQEKAYWGVLTGNAFKKVFWNETTNKVAVIPRMETGEEEVLDEEGNPAVDEITGLPRRKPVERQAVDEFGMPAVDEFDVGDVDTAIIPPYNIALPASARSPLEIGWIMEYSLQKIDWIKETYGKKADGYTGKAKEVTEEKGLSKIMQLEYSLRSLVGRRSGRAFQTGAESVETKNSAVLKEYYSPPTKKFPKGRMVAVANHKTLYAGDNPYHVEGHDDSWNPYVHWRFEIVPGRCWGKNLVSDLVPLNRRVNAIDALIILNRKTMAVSQWLIPNGCGVANGYINGRPGLNILYNPVGASGAKPEKVAATPLPQQVYQEREQVVEDIKRIGMTQDVLEGTNPQGVKTAYQLEQLLENALASLGATFQRWEKSYEQEEKKKLLLISQRYKEPRPEFGKKLKSINKDITDIELEMFTGENLRDNVNVRVEPGSSIPRSKAGENAVLRELVQNGILDVIGNSVNKREFLDKVGVKGFDYQSSPDVKRAQWENSVIEAGNIHDLVVDPETNATILELDDHETHLIIHSSRMKSPNLTHEQRKTYLLHIEEHLQMLRSAAEAQAPPAGPGEQQTQQINKEQVAQGAV